MHYTIEELLDEFTKEVPKYRRFLYKPVFLETDLFKLSPLELRNLVTSHFIQVSHQAVYLSQLRKALSDFFDWSVAKGGIIATNIFQTEACSFNVWFEYVSDKINLKLYYPEDIDEIISKIKYNKELCEMIIRLIYEGIVEIKPDLINLKLSQIDLENGYIDKTGHKMKISERLVSVIKSYLNINRIIFVQENATLIKKIYRFQEYLIKVPNQYEDDEFDKYNRYINGYFYSYIMKLISKNNNDFDVNMSDLYASGFIQFVKHDCEILGKNDLYFVNIFKVKRRNASFEGKITDYANKYGHKGGQGPLLRMKYYPYVRQSKYYREE